MIKSLKRYISDPLPLIAVGIWLAVFCVVPLYYERAYFNMSQAKSHAYNSCSVLLLVLYSLFLLYRLSFRKAKKHKQESGVELPGLCFAALGLAGLVSCVLSGDPAASFWGENGWGMGAFALLSFNLFMHIMRKELVPGGLLLLPVAAANSAIFLFSLLHSAGVDIFLMHKGVSSGDYYTYTSTIGNLNWYSGYLCLILPLFVMIFISCPSRKKGTTLAVFLFFSFLNSAVASSDSFYIGIGICSFFAVPYIAARTERLSRLFICITLYGTALFTANILPFYRQRTEVADGLAQLMLKPPVFIAIMLSGLSGFAAVRLWGRDNGAVIRKICSYCLYGIPAAACAYHTADTVLSFSDAWGSSRGYIWRKSIEVYLGFTPVHKLIGTGPAMLKEYLAGVFPGLTLNSAHNEALQFLLTAGIIGLLLWLLAWGSLFASYFIKKGWKNGSAVYFVPIAAYTGWSMINSSNICCYGILCALTACYLRELDEACRAAEPRTAERSIR